MVFTLNQLTANAFHTLNVIYGECQLHITVQVMQKLWENVGEGNNKLKVIKKLMYIV